jgi:hypothetical protein
VNVFGTAKITNANPTHLEEWRRNRQYLVQSWIHDALVDETGIISDNLPVIQLEKSGSELSYGTVGG